MVRAVDGPELELFAVLELHRRIHVFGVELRVSALPVQVESCHVRGPDVEITARQLLIHDEALELAPDGGAVRKPERQAWPDTIVDREELQVLAQLLVVALFRLFEELQVIVELALRLPRGPVDAGQLRLLLVSPPVGPGDTHQLEGLQILRRAHVGSTAQVQKLTGPIHADLVAFDLVMYQFELVDLVTLRELLDRLLARQHLVHERDVGLSKPAHARLDRG